jgi:hypothetical protein
MTRKVKRDSFPFEAQPPKDRNDFPLTTQSDDDDDAMSGEEEKKEEEVRHLLHA